MSQYPNVFERFAKIYAGLGDEQLLSLASDLDQLEPDAQEALQAELQVRQLQPRSVVKVEAAEEVHPESGEKLDGPESEWVFETADQAYAARNALESAGIRTVLNLPPSNFYNQSPSVIFVCDDQLKLQAIYDELHSRDEDAEIVTDFIAPACPGCGDTAPLLISVEPANEWACGNCGHTWQES